MATDAVARERQVAAARDRIGRGDRIERGDRGGECGRGRGWMGLVARREPRDHDGEQERDADGEDDLAGYEPEPEDGQRPLRAVLATAAELRAGPLADVRLEVLHGRMPAEDKDRVMRAFAAGDVDVLVATTVIEVGVDVANATVMVVLDAERYGVSQLHQLRGRVGRGEDPGLCLLVTAAAAGSPARDRLDAVAASTDGFALAYLDLEQRREGDVLGASQSGRRSHLRLLSLLRDEELILSARTAAAELIAADPGLTAWPRLADQVAEIIGEDRSRYLDKA